MPQTDSQKLHSLNVFWNLWSTPIPNSFRPSSISLLYSDVPLIPRSVPDSNIYNRDENVIFSTICDGFNVGSNSETNPHLSVGSHQSWIRYFAIFSNKNLTKMFRLVRNDEWWHFIVVKIGPVQWRNVVLYLTTVIKWSSWIGIGFMYRGITTVKALSTRASHTWIPYVITFRPKY